jgi:hypothetical protein
VSGLDAAGASVAGTAYTDDFTVAPPSSTVLASGDGCALSGTAGSYTLTVTRPDAGSRACTVTAIHTATTTAVAAVEFAAAPPLSPATLGAPTGLECAWPTQAGGKVECTWDPVTGATGGYAVRYEITLDLRGTIRTIAREKTETSTEFSIGLNKYITRVRLQTAAVGADRTGPYTAWAEVRRPGPAPRNLGVECRSDAGVHVRWDAVAGASAYDATITSTPPPSPTAVPLVSTRNLERSSPNSEPPAGFGFDGRAGWAYAVQVTALVSGTASLPATASAACTPVAPPAPTGVTASCSNRVLTVTWSAAGGGLAKAASYEPRIFTGESTTPDTRWTANTAGHTSTTATIPAPGEPDLPTTGVFQVRVKATNAAGDSDWSAPVEATCGAPGPIEGLKCAAITKGQITIEWSTAVGAQNYSLVIAPTPTGTSQPPLSITAVQGETQSHTFSGLHSGHLHRIAVQPVNAKLGPTATLECTTVDNDWLEVECSNSGVLTADWDDPSGDGPAPSGYSAVVYFDDPERGRGAVHTYVGTGTSTMKALVQGRRYVVSLVSGNGNGGPVYSQTATHTCPGPQRPAWNSPNDRDTSVWRLFDAAVIAVVGMLTRNIDAGFWTAEQGTGLLTGKKNPSLARTSRSCRQPTKAELADDSDLDRVCEETWSESVNVRMKPLTSWQQLRIVEAFRSNTGEEIVARGTELLTGAVVGIVVAVLAGGSVIVATIGAVVGATLAWGAGELSIIIYREATGEYWARLFPESFVTTNTGERYCMPADTDTHNGDEWELKKTVVASNESVDGYKTRTEATISYCKES